MALTPPYLAYEKQTLLSVQSKYGLAILVGVICFQSACYSQVNGAAAAAAASGISKQIAAQEWLGPLSAIALSPFFGLACLSGAATYGPEWLQSRSSLMGSTSPLNNPILFWVMLGLTITTSLPRLTKVTKPFALVVEKLEMYSAVIILISLKYLSGGGMTGEQGVAQPEMVVMAAGVVSLPWDVLLSLSAAINVLIVNTIKLAIEILVWIVPFPTVDAILEVANKSLCASLMALYAYSPWLSTAINFVILGLCCIVFFRVRRRIVYVRELVMRPLISKILGMEMNRQSFTGFLSKPWREFPIRTAFTIVKTGPGDQIEIVYRGWTKRLKWTCNIDPTAYRTRVLCDQMSVFLEGSEVTFDIRLGLVPLSPVGAPRPAVSS